MQELISKIMNASTFSCGDRVATLEVQPPEGYASAPFDRSPEATWMSENTTRPQRSSGICSSGVVNERYWTEGWPFAVWSRWIQRSASAGLTALTVCCAAVIGILPSVDDAWTL